MVAMVLFTRAAITSPTVNHADTKNGSQDSKVSITSNPAFLQAQKLLPHHIMDVQSITVIEVGGGYLLSILYFNVPIIEI